MAPTRVTSASATNGTDLPTAPNAPDDALAAVIGTDPPLLLLGDVAAAGGGGDPFGELGDTGVTGTAPPPLLFGGVAAAGGGGDPFGGIGGGKVWETICDTLRQRRTNNLGRTARYS